jgi:hypothetical protein
MLRSNFVTLVRGVTVELEQQTIILVHNNIYERVILVGGSTEYLTNADILLHSSTP